MKIQTAEHRILDEERPLLTGSVQEEAQSRNTDSYPRHVDADGPFFGIGFMGLSLILLGDFLANADGTFVLAVYNSIASEFDRGSLGPWLVISETLAYCITLPVYGTICDKFGSRKPLLSAYSIFAAGCCISGTASTFTQVLVGRSVSGIAAAGMTATTAIVIAENASPVEAGVLRSYASIFSILGRTAGGPIGGLLADKIGWRWSFICEIPFAMLCSGSFLTLGPIEVHNESQTLLGHDSGRNSKTKPTDFPGIVLLGVMLLTLMLCLDRIDRNTGWRSPWAIVFLVLFFLSGAGFATVEIKAAEDALIPPSLLRGGTRNQYLMAMICMFCQLAMISNIPTYFARTMNASNSRTALSLLPATIGNIAGAFIAGRVIRRIRRWKIIASVGLIFCALGYFLMSLRWRGPISIVESLYVFLPSFGVSALNTSQFVALTAATPEGRTGIVISIFYLAQNIGMMTGVSTSTSVVGAIFKHQMLERFPAVNDREKIIEKIFNNTRFAFSLSTGLQKLVFSSYLQGFFALSLILGCMSLSLQALVFISPSSDL